MIVCPICKAVMLPTISSCIMECVRCPFTLTMMEACQSYDMQTAADLKANSMLVNRGK